MNDDPTALISAEGIAAYLQGVPDGAAQFDFMLGSWQATVTRYRRDGTELGCVPGRWQARHLHGGRMLLDEFLVELPDGTEISSMTTLRTFSAETGRWQMTFLLSHQTQPAAALSGTFEGGEMQLAGRATTLDGTEVLSRVRFFAIRPDAFEWENHVSLDGGTSWYRDCAISCVRA